MVLQSTRRALLGRRLPALTLFLLIACALLLLCEGFPPFTWGRSETWPMGQSGAPDADSRRPPSEVAVVVASRRSEDTSWLSTAFPEWDKFIYVVDNPFARLTVGKNKGREGMVYLTYIIDHYDTLSNITVFHHANRYQWHIDDPLYDAQYMLSQLQLPFVREQGYVNLRCVWVLGCPVEIRPIVEAAAPAPASDPKSDDARAGSFFKKTFEDLFPGLPVPEAVGVACCAQFAVTAAQIRQRPRRDYERYRDWLRTTRLNDHLSGIIMEYLWHIIFGKGAVFCPDASTCYCTVYGICNMQCDEPGFCRGYYTLPNTPVLPKGWPEIGWDGEKRNVTQLRADLEAQFTHQTPSPNSENST